jgi:hypothetical protein
LGEDSTISGEELRILNLIFGGDMSRKLTLEFLDHDSVYEIIYGHFIELLKRLFRKDPNSYTFASIHYDDVVAQYLEQYLKEHRIPYILKGFDKERRIEVPHRYSCVIDRYELENVYSFGIFNIYPETDEEIFYYAYGPFGRINRRVTFVACRRLETLNNLLDGIKKYYVYRVRSGGLLLNADREETVTEEVHWDDVILPEELYKSIRISIESFLKGKHIYQRLSIPYKRGILFAGNPGNGKTLLCKAIAWESKLPFILFPLNESVSDFELDNAFDLALDLSPSIICFEDLDSIRRTHITLSYFLNKIDGFETLNGVLILATTNKPEDIDAALSNRPSRFDSVFRIPNPDEECRYRMIKRYFKDSIDDELANDLVLKTKGFSMAYLKELYLLSIMTAINRGTDIVNEDDVNSALKVIHRQILTGNKPLEREAVEVGFKFGNFL